jgi:hypothetical protein
VYDLGVVDAETMDPDTESYAYGISNLDFIVGLSTQPFVTDRAFIWKPIAEPTWDTAVRDAGMKALATGNGTIARKINADSVIVGDLDSPAGRYAFMWQPTPVVPELGTFVLHALPDVANGTGVMEAHAVSVDSSPLFVVGQAVVEDGTLDDTVGFLWSGASPTASPEILTGPGSGFQNPDHFAFGMSASGVFVAGGTADKGQCESPGCGVPVALEWDLTDSNPAIADTLPRPAAEDSARGLDVRDDGVVVGVLSDASLDLNDHAIVWNWGPQDEMVDLHLATGMDEEHKSQASAIRNDADEIVGANTQTNEAMLWRHDGSSWEAIVLNDTIDTCAGDWDLREASDINEHGWIVGSGFHRINGVQEARAFVLVPRDRACSADVAGPAGPPDGVVDVQDLLRILADWGTCTCVDQCRADTDGDGEIGVGDLLNVLAQYSTARYACDGSGTVPQTVDDCIQKIGYGDPVALEACIEMVTGGS